MASSLLSTPAALLALLTGQMAAAPETAGGGGVVEFVGACDASGAVPLDGHRFVVADDEDNVLRVYDAGRGGMPVREGTGTRSCSSPTTARGSSMARNASG